MRCSKCKKPALTKANGSSYGYCLEHKRAWNRTHYQRNKAGYIAKARAYSHLLKDFITRAKSKPCSDCRREYPPYVMDFDHRNGAKKTFRLSLGRRSGLKKVKAEIAKCDVVCANCHRERTHRRQKKKKEKRKS